MRQLVKRGVGCKNEIRNNNTRVAVLFFSNDNFTTQAFNDGFSRFYGLKGTSQYKQFDFIYCIHDDQIIHIKKAK